MSISLPSSARQSLPARLAAFLDLIKFAHTIFALPFAMLAATMATAAIGWSWRRAAIQFALILACMFAARTFAMTVNRLADRAFDRRNPRTARRPSVTGVVSLRFMWSVTAACALLFAAATFLFLVLLHNPWPSLLASPVLFWIGLYSFTKRFTALCHFFLGISLGLAPVSAWIAIAPPNAPFLTPAAALLGLAVTFWVAGFDILYALQDEAIDRQEGLHSIPAALGRRKAIWVSRGCHLLAAAALAAVGLTGQFGPLYWTGAALAAILLVVEQWLVSPEDISKINIAFMTVNGIVGIVFGGLAIGDVVWRMR